jgi:hypothetical protein
MVFGSERKTRGETNALAKLDPSTGRIVRSSQYDGDVAARCRSRRSFAELQRLGIGAFHLVASPMAWRVGVTGRMPYVAGARIAHHAWRDALAMPWLWFLAAVASSCTSANPGNTDTDTPASVPTAGTACPSSRPVSSTACADEGRVCAYGPRCCVCQEHGCGGWCGPSRENPPECPSVAPSADDPCPNVGMIECGYCIDGRPRASFCVNDGVVYDPWWAQGPPGCGFL